MSPEELMWAWLREGWKYRVKQGWNPNIIGKGKYVAQINREMAEIIAKGYPSYFLMVSDIIRFAKSKQIAVGPGRGSSAASFCCFLLRITEPDPMMFPLCDFTRFIDPTRSDLPDIDIDFDDERRHEVREYCVQKYGIEHVGNVGNFTKWKGKNSLDDVQRVYQLPKAKIEELKGMIVERSGGDSRADASLIDTIEMFEKAKEVAKAHPEVYRAAELEGNYRGMSTHAAGVVVCSVPIRTITAMYTREVKGRQITAVATDKYDCEAINLMKVDLLGLSTMGMLSLALKFAGMTLEDLYRIPLDDPETIAAFHRNDVIGVFQFEGRATRLVGMELKPDNFLELVDVNALSRPGPLFSGTTNEYISVKHGKMKPTKLHPIIDEITKDTHGQIIYQEQILHSLSRFGGLSVKRVHEIRRIISKKLGEAQFNTSANDFAENAGKMHGVSKELAMEVWSRVVTSASYAFVYSHSLAYTMIGYWAMWLKVHHPTAFYASQLEKIPKEKWGRLIKDARKHGIEVRGVTPGLSSRTWAPVDDKTVVAGWLQLNGVGPGKADSIEEFIANGGQIKQASDLLQVKGIGPAGLEKFRAQMDSDDPFGLERVGRVLRACRDCIRTGEIPLRQGTHVSEEILDIDGEATVVFMGMVKHVEYKDFVENQRSRTGAEAADIRASMKRPDLVSFASLQAYDEFDEDVYLRISRYKFPQFKRDLESLRLDHDVVWVIAKKSAMGFGASLQVEQLVIIDPDD